MKSTILELVILNIKPDLNNKFEQDFSIASTYISSIKGYIQHELCKCVEHENEYVLLVIWENIESHEVDFRNSDAYQKWKELLHNYYDPFPKVKHYEMVFKNWKK